MPIIIAAFLGGLATAAASLVGRVLLALGMSYVAYSGIDTALGTLKTLIITNMASGLGSAVVGLLGVFKVDVAISMIFSAFAARLVLMGLTSGVVKKLMVR
jgi:hypothetical protein